MDVHEAAALWGSAENKAYPIEVRLNMALAALDFFAAEETEVEEEVEEEVFLYDEKNEIVSSISKYHTEHFSIESLVEARPGVIYFYATMTQL